MSDELKGCPVCGEKPVVSSELTVSQWASCANPSCVMFGMGFSLANWNRPRPVEEAQEGIIAILEFFRDDAKSAAAEAVELLEEINFHCKVPERWKRVTDNLRKIVSREGMNE